MFPFLAIVLAASSCTREGDVIYVPDPNEEQASTAPLVTVIYDVNALGDRSYNDLIYQGVEQTAQELGLRTMQQSPQTMAEGLQYLELMFRQMEQSRDSVRRLFIVASPGYDDFIRKNSHRLEGNPYADLLYLETQEPLEDKGSTLFLPYYGAMYEAGKLSTLVGNHVTIIAANRQTPAVTDAVRGFSDGFEEDAVENLGNQESKNLSVTYIDETGSSGFSIADTTALRILGQLPKWGYSHSLLPICGGAFSNFCRINEITQGEYRIIGVDKTYESIFSDLSVVKHIDGTLGLCIRQWLSAEGLPKHQVLGLKAGFTEVVRLYERFPGVALSPEVEKLLTPELLGRLHEEAVRKEAAYEGQ